MSDKKIFSAEKIRTSEICGVDNKLILNDISGIAFSSINAGNISGTNLTIAGSGDTSITARSGVFEELVVNGVRYVPRNQIAYAFRFGGPPVLVPSILPAESGSNNYTGLVLGTNLVFVEDSGSFRTGDHILVGGLYDENEVQEKHTVTGIAYYEPEICCNAKVNTSVLAGSNRVYYDNERNNISNGDKITITGSKIYEVNGTALNYPKYFETTTPLESDITQGDCICCVQPTLLTENVLQNDFVAGTLVANKYPRTILATGVSGKCPSTCYDTQHLYLEKAMYYHNDFDWNLTGYREAFVGFSGIDINITGQNTSGLLTLNYPDF
jgi:hypothetical protein